MKPKSFGFQVVLNCEKRFNHHHHIKKKLSILFGVNETLIFFRLNRVQRRECKTDLGVNRKSESSSTVKIGPFNTAFRIKESIFALKKS